MPKFSLNVNGEVKSVDIDADTPLLWVLRDNLGLVGTKYGCGVGQCGACTVHLNGNAARSCQVPVSAATSGKITTIEGIASDGKLTSLQQAWCDHDVAQCGYCQSGQIMSAMALLAKKRKPNDDDIDAAMIGNLCRCGTYTRIRAAIHAAAETK
ncbi:MAG: (2Fe-2S)-binding protein [Tepidisphaeraceae bacterium]